MLLLLLAALAVVSTEAAPKWLLVQTYQGLGGCNTTNPLVYFQVTPSFDVCPPAGQCVCANGVCQKSECTDNPPLPPTTLVGYFFYTDSSCTGANIYSYTAYRGGACINAITPSSYYVSCESTGFAKVNTYSLPNCTGTPSTQTFPPYCFQASPGQNSFQSNCPSGAPGTCFSPETRITLPHSGESFTMAELKASSSSVAAAAAPSSSCVIPHSVQATGVRISAVRQSDGQGERALLVTDDHLVVTESGMRRAKELRTGDVLFGANSEERLRVTRVERDYSVKEYMGLNCEESVVVANGIMASTFGNFHAVPSAFMKVLSKFVGINKAASVGDWIAATLYSWKLI